MLDRNYLPRPISRLPRLGRKWSGKEAEEGNPSSKVFKGGQVGFHCTLCRVPSTRPSRERKRLRKTLKPLRCWPREDAVLRDVSELERKDVLRHKGSSGQKSPNESAAQRGELERFGHRRPDSSPRYRL